MKELDPIHGTDLHKTGTKADAGKIRAALMLDGFARALTEVAKVTTFGAEKYTENGWRTVPRGQKRYRDALLRHLLKDGGGESIDSDSQLLHLAHVAWCALAVLELRLREGDPEYPAE